MHKLRQKLFSYLGLLVLLGTFMAQPLSSVSAENQTPSTIQTATNSAKTATSAQRATEESVKSAKNTSSTNQKTNKTTTETTHKKESATSSKSQPRAPTTKSLKQIPLTITGQSLVDSNGNPITKADQNTSFVLNIDFSLPNNTANQDDYSDIKLPDSLKLTSATFEVKNSAGEKIADAVLDATTKTIHLVYTDYVDTHSDITGKLYVGAKVDTQVVTEDKEIPLTLTINGDATYDAGHLNYGVVKADMTEQFSKSAWFTDGNTRVINYALNVNVSGKAYTDAEIKDTLESAGISYDQSSIKIEKGTWKLGSDGSAQLENAQDVTSNFAIDMKNQNQGFSIKLGDIDSNEGYNITYQVKIDHEASNGEVFKNEAVMVGNNTTVRDTPVSTTYQSAGGEANGYNYTIKLHKVNQDNHDLAGAVFNVVRDSTGKSVGTITTDDSGLGQLTGLLKDDYTITETKAPTGYTLLSKSIKISSDDFGTDKAVTKKVTDQEEKTQIEGTKTWSDQDNQDGIRPKQVTVNLLADGKKVATKTVTAAENWHYSFTNLAKYESGKVIDYTISEDAVPGYTTSYDGNDITNKHTPAQTQIEGTKTWSDQDNQDGTRPKQVSINLLANGKKVATKTVTATDNWHYKFDNLPKYEAGKAITYTITEDSVAGYTTTYDGNNITNSYTPSKTSLSVTKVWDDNNNQDGLRPTSIQVQLYANGEASGLPVTLNAQNDWRYTWQNLAQKKAGQTITYTAKEIGKVKGYQTATTKTNKNTIITNQHTPAQTEISGTKTWSDDDNQDGKRPDKITVNLLANGKKVASQTVTAADNWQYHFGNLAQYENGQAINYTITEDTVTGYSTTYNGNNIINHYTPGKTSISVSKNWVDANNQDGLRPASVQVQLYANGQANGAPVTLTEKGNWQYTWQNLAQKKAGQTIVYTVKEVGTISGYQAAITQTGHHFVITNQHTPATTQINGTKTWDDHNDQDGTRPHKITVNLLANGQSIVSKTVTANDNWRYHFDNLPKYENGKRITYTVTETPVTGYSTSYQGNNITNRYTPGKTSFTVTKAWQDNNNQSGLRPKSVRVQLYANHQKVGEPVAITASNNWRYTWTNLAKKQAGKTIVYTAKEVDQATGYQATVSGNVQNQLTITNTLITGSVILTKEDSQSGAHLQNAVFELQNDQGKVLKKNLITNAKGVLSINQLMPGRYQLIETTAPAGYQKDTQPVKFTIRKNQQTAVKVKKTNQRQPGTIILEKTDQDTGKLLPGATFKLLDGSGKTVIKTMTTDTTGRLVIRNLTAGTYHLVETTAPKGYILDTKPIKVVVKTPQQKSVTVKKSNREKPRTLRVEKVDRDTDQPLAGAVFELRDEQGHVLKQNLITDTSGVFAVSNLKVGNYQLVETKAPKGYRLSQQRYPVSIMNDSQLVTLKISNQAIRNHVPNKPHNGTYMPQTGEHITIFFSVLGLIILLLAGMLLVLKIKQRNS